MFFLKKKNPQQQTNNLLLVNESKKDGKDQESIQSTTPGLGYLWESGNFTIRHHTQDPRCQPFPSRWPQGINKQTRMKA